MSNANTTVLVTGGSGFIGSHVVNRLLHRGYNVRTTVRSLSKSATVQKQVLPPDDPSAASRLALFPADLLKDDGWAEAVKDCDYVLHVASPFPLEMPKDENELIKPAVEGTLRALRFAKEAGVKRVVVTSSFAAIGYGHESYDKVLDESEWSNPDSSEISAYAKSKTLAERAAWDYQSKNPSIELAVVNPVGVFGPLLPGTTDIGSSVSIVQSIMSGKMPAAPKILFGIVDVRDIADMHILAMTKPEAAGKRFLGVTGDGAFHSLQDIGAALGKSVWTLPDFIPRLFAPFSATLTGLLPEIGKLRKSSNKRAREVLGVTFIGMEESVRASAESLKEAGKL